MKELTRILLIMDGVILLAAGAVRFNTLQNGPVNYGSISSFAAQSAIDRARAATSWYWLASGVASWLTCWAAAAALSELALIRAALERISPIPMTQLKGRVGEGEVPEA